jgi:hypothetical protein
MGLELSDALIAYDDAGEGEPVVFLTARCLRTG